MLYIFTGNSEFLLQEAIYKWKNQFITKFGDFNLLHIKDLLSIDTNFLAGILFASGFLNEKKLIIIDIESDLDEKLSEFFINSLNKIPENNIIVFAYLNPDKRLKFYKELEKQAEKREYSVENEDQTAQLIQKRYNGKISNKAINLIIKYKANNLSKIIQEIEKLLIIYQFIDEKEIVENIFPELEESVFQIIDEILNLKIINAIEKIKNLTNEINIYAFYNNLLANLRANIFILKLKKEGKNASNISQILNLGNRTFLVNKSYFISYEKLLNLFINLGLLDKKMKSGNMIGTEDEDFLFELENVLLQI